MFQVHPVEMAAIEKKIDFDKNITKQESQQKNKSITDLILTLIAKDLMPVRIVESQNFINLLEGKFCC